jgi:hypothetical protein
MMVFRLAELLSAWAYNAYSASVDFVVWSYAAEISDYLLRLGAVTRNGVEEGSRAAVVKQLRALRPRQTRSAPEARRTAVTPAKTSDSEGGWDCFRRGSMLGK